MASQTRSVNNTVSSTWANPDNAFAEDDLCTSTSTTGAQNVYNFANNLFSIPAGNVIDGIVVKIVRGGDADDYYQIELRDEAAAWYLRNGTAYLASCAGAVLETLGGVADPWSAKFSPAHVNSADFQVRLTFIATGKKNTMNVDHIEVTVYYGPPSSTDSYATAYPFQRKSFYAAGRHWIWYSDGTNLVYRSSSDGLGWSWARSVGGCTIGDYSSVFFDGVFVHYARWHIYDLFYRRGTPQSDGTIDWSAVQQTVYNGNSSDHFWYPMVAVDSGGYAWIGARRILGDYPQVLKNANNDGTWSTATGFPYQLNDVSSGSWRVIIVPLTNQRVYVVYGEFKDPVLGRLYDGSWGDEENDLGEYDALDGSYNSAMGEGDDVHFGYLRHTTYQIRYNKRTYGVGWQVADELVQDTVAFMTAPALSIDKATGNVYCFWAGSPTADHIYYKKRVAGTWDANPTDWIDETVEDLMYNDTLTCFRQAYGGYIGLLYTTKKASPHYIRFAYLTMPAVYEASARLIGTVIPVAIYNAQVRNSGTIIAPFSTLVRNIGNVVFPYSSWARLIGVVVLPFSTQVRNIGTVVFPYSSRVRLVGSIYQSYSSSVRNIGTILLVALAKCHAELSTKIRRRIF